MNFSIEAHGQVTPAYLMRAWETVMPGFIPSASGILGLDPMESAGYLLYISGGDLTRAFALAVLAIGGSEGQEARKKWTDSARLLLECEPVQVAA